jgi:hypothetical protein
LDLSNGHESEAESDYRELNERIGKDSLTRPTSPPRPTNNPDDNTGTLNIEN